MLLRINIVLINILIKIEKHLFEEKILCQKHNHSRGVLL